MIITWYKNAKLKKETIFYKSKIMFSQFIHDIFITKYILI